MVAKRNVFDDAGNQRVPTTISRELRGLGERFREAGGLKPVDVHDELPNESETFAVGPTVAQTLVD